MSYRKKLIAAGAGLVVAATVFAGATPAFAAQQSGSRLCSGTKTPSITVNTSSGNLVWSKYDSPSVVAPAVQLPSGTTTKYSPYQRTYYTVTAMTIFSLSTTCA